MAGENNFFSPGETRLIFTFRGVKISPFYLLRSPFPPSGPGTGIITTLLYLQPTGLKTGGEAWNILLKARAIENQCYVAGVNRIGTDGNGIKYCGDSMIVDPRGAIIASSDPLEESSYTGEISLSELQDFRKKFPVLNDADNFTINF